MIELKDLLLGFQNIILSEEAKKDTIRSVFLEETGLDIKREDMEIKNGTLFLHIKPLYKNEIFIKREKIAARLKESLGKKAPGEFR